MYDFLAPEPHSLVLAVGDVSGKGVPAALYSAFAGELVRSRTFRRRYTSERSSPAGVLASMNTILHERQLEQYYCTLCYALFDFKRRTRVTMANSGLPYPVRCSGGQRSADRASGCAARIVRRFRVRRSVVRPRPGDVYVFCTDGVFETTDAQGREFGVERLSQVVLQSRKRSARAIVEEVFAAVSDFRGDRPQRDDMTVVALRVTS